MPQHRRTGDITSTSTGALAEDFVESIAAAAVQQAMTLINQQLQNIIERVVRLEGGLIDEEVDQEENPTTEITPDTVFKFNSTSTLPAGVTFSRASTGYSRDSGGLITSKANDVARYSHDSLDNLTGLLIENTRSNKLPYGLKPGGTGWTTVGSVISVTVDNQIAPDGTTTATKVVFPAGVTSRGDALIRQGLTVSSTLPMARSIWLKSLEFTPIVLSIRTSNGSDLESISVPTEWTRFDVKGIISSGYINFDVACDVDYGTNQSFAVWGATMYEDENVDGWSDYPHNTSSGTVTRAKDVLTMTVPAGTYNVELVWSNGVKQLLTSRDCTSGSFTYDPATDEPLGRRLHCVNFIDPTDAPDVTNPNTETDGLLSKAGIISDMKLLNDDSPLYLYPEYNPGRNAAWSRGGIVVMGADYRGNFVPTWYQKSGVSNDYTDRAYWTDQFLWFVLWTGANHGVCPNTRVLVERMELLHLYAGQTEWQIVQSTNSTDGAVYPRSVAGTAGQSGIDKRTESGGRVSYRGPNSGAAADPNIVHGWTGGGFNVIDNPAALRGVMARCVVSLILHDENAADDRLESDYQFQQGADLYPYNVHNANSFPNGFIPGIGGNRFKKVTTAKQASVFVNIDPTDDGSHTEGGFITPAQNQILSLADFNASTIPDFRSLV